MKPSDRLAQHLADVKNSDKAHRLIRPETEQKLEALTRLVVEHIGFAEPIHAFVVAQMPADEDRIY